MAGTINVDTLKADSNLKLQIASANVAFIDANGLTIVGNSLNVGGGRIVVTANSAIINPTITTPTVSGNLSLDSTGTTGVRSPAANTISFHTAGTEDMRITSAGYVGIGTTTPASKLDVFSDTVTFGDTGSFNFSIKGTNILFKNGTSGTTERMRITSGGVLLLNETSTGSSPLMQISGDTSSYNNLTIKDTGTTYSTGNRFAMFTNSSDAVAGQIQHTGVTTTAFATSSDQRLKENIVDAPNALNKVMDIKIRSYDWKEDKSHVEYGLVAQEINEIYNEPVGVGGEDVNQEPWNIEYGRLTPILLKAIQELNAKVDAQAVEIAALKAKQI